MWITPLPAIDSAELVSIRSPSSTISPAIGLMRPETAFSMVVLLVAVRSDHNGGAPGVHVQIEVTDDHRSVVSGGETQ